MVKRRKQHKKFIYPMVQGHLKEDSETKICGTGRYKTTLTIIQLNTGKEFLCVYWSNLTPIKKGELVLAKGLHSAKDARLFFCTSVHKIPYPYDFGVVD